MFEIVYRHNDFLIVNKPADCSFHSESRAGFIAQLQQQEQAEQLYPVHRLDKMTSGLLIVALNKAAAQSFQKLFEQHQVEKIYLAIAGSKPKKKQGWVKGDMSPARRGSWKLTNTQINPAITRFKSFALRPQERLYVLKPITGRTHQLRVAMKSLAVAIYGDKRYAPLKQAELEQRGYLHAFALRFVYQNQHFEFKLEPDQGERFQSDEFHGCLAELCQPSDGIWSLFEG